MGQQREIQNHASLLVQLSTTLDWSFESLQYFQGVPCAHVGHHRTNSHHAMAAVGSSALSVGNVVMWGTCATIDGATTTVIVARMSHWKWRETKQQPSRAKAVVIEENGLSVQY